MESGWKEASKQKEESKKKSNIPQEIIDDILIRLPLKSVIRFKAVSKLWNSTISNPSFHRIHHPVTCIFTVIGCNPLIFELIDEKGRIEQFRAPSWCKLQNKGRHCIKTSNSCNGMLLLCTGTHIFLINPTTHYIDIVLTLDELFDSRQLCNFDSIQMGFCYDESIDDYKALIFHGNNTTTTTIFVASLKEKVWTALPRPIGLFNASPGPLVNNRLHATTTSDFDDFGFGIDFDDFSFGEVIVYFNPMKSDFEHVPGPELKYGVRDNIVSLGVLKGCLCVARDIGRAIQVLIMKEYGIANSWTNLFVLPDLTMSFYYDCFKLLLETNNGYILISYNQMIWWYNLANKSFTKFVYSNPMVNPVTFVENLCSPNGETNSEVSNCEGRGNTSGSSGKKKLQWTRRSPDW